MTAGCGAENTFLTGLLLELLEMNQDHAFLIYTSVYLGPSLLSASQP